ncbi:MAG: hypothetical protein Q7W30_08040 [Coriobacteriia bacterium]|nr:hypothetical protein [Coriobacteriia bacterium]
MKSESWVSLFGVDPRPWLLEGDEPGARWLALTGLLDLSSDDPRVIAAHDAVMADPGTQALLDRLRPWDEDIALSGHDKPAFAPNLLSVLGDMGVGPDDDPRIGRVLAAMLEHQDVDGRFQSCSTWRGREEPTWGALACDAHAIAETLARFGYADDPRVARAFERIAADIVNTEQGRAWLCRPDPDVPFRGPGRKGEFCPQVTLEALRAFSWLPAERRPGEVVATGRVSLRAWRERGTEKPYMFGHGRNFKRGKWPVTWYCALEMVDVIGRYPDLWAGPDAAPEDRRALAEVVACLAAYNVGADGRVTPQSCFKGFEDHSFGQKKRPSALATAQVAVALRRLEPIIPEVAAVDVAGLGSSKGGSGTALPPR